MTSPAVSESRERFQSQFQCFFGLLVRLSTIKTRSQVETLAPAISPINKALHLSSEFRNCQQNEVICMAWTLKTNEFFEFFFFPRSRSDAASLVAFSRLFRVVDLIWIDNFQPFSVVTRLFRRLRTGMRWVRLECYFGAWRGFGGVPILGRWTFWLISRADIATQIVPRAEHSRSPFSTVPRGVLCWFSLIRSKYYEKGRNVSRTRLELPVEPTE